MLTRIFIFVLCCLLTALPVKNSAAEDALSERIDALIEEAAQGNLATPASDAEFLRRVYLDLTGTIPSAEEARAFLDDPSSTKRLAVVDKLLESPQYARYMATVFDVMLVERRSGKHINQDQWVEYLRKSFQDNKSWNQLAKEILAADGSDDNIRPAAKFYLAREAEANAITRDVARMFFGMDLQCCQCHDHPLIDAYLQSDYYGIFAFVNRGFLFTDKDKKVFYAEKAEGNVEFTSVFTDEKGVTRPRLPGDLQIREPTQLSGDEYRVKPADKVRPIPSYSRRKQLADLATSGENQAFNRNIVNRLWAHLFGRGLVSPLDLHHSDNLASHPELLALLAAEFKATNYDIRAFFKTVISTRTYQRSVEFPAELELTAETLQKRRASLDNELAQAKQVCEEIGKGLAEARKLLQGEEGKVKPLRDAFDEANKKLAEALKKSDEAAKKLKDAVDARNAKEAAADALQEALASTQAVLATLPEDKEVQAAKALFEKRIGELSKAVEEAKPAISTLEEPAQATAAVTAEARQEAAAKLQLVEQQLNATDPMRGQAKKLLDQLTAAEKQRARLQALASTTDEMTGLLKRRAEVARLTQTLETQAQGVAKARAEMEQAQATLATIAKDLSQSESEMEDVTARTVTAQAARDKQRALTEKVAGAAAQLAVAAKTLSEDAEFADALQVVQDRQTKLQASLQQKESALAVVFGEQKKAAARLAEMQRTMRDQQVRLKQLQQRVSELESQRTATTGLLEKSNVERSQQLAAMEESWGRHAFTAELAPLSPEAMAWSMMQATGFLRQQHTAALPEIDKQLPVNKDDPENVDRLRERAFAQEKWVHDKVKGHLSAFVKLFGHAGGQPQSDFFATVDQALFFANGGTVNSWTNPSGGNLTERLNKLEDPASVAEELYLSILTRRPSDDEIADVKTYLQDRKDQRPQALKEMTWALLTSSEFRFRF